jgi:secondary thiamine-phosphate synthase enzyme
MAQHVLRISTSGPGLYEFTAEAAAFVGAQTARAGLLTVFVQHTSCSLLVQENADKRVRDDLIAFFKKLVPPTSDPAMLWVSHNDEGPDDMPAHIKAALTQTSIGIPVSGGKLMLGTWQGLYLFEHRDTPHERQIVLHLGA